ALSVVSALARMDLDPGTRPPVSPPCPWKWPPQSLPRCLRAPRRLFGAALAGSVYGNAQIAAELGASLGALRRSHEEMMARKILLVLADPAQAKVVRRSLIDSRESPLEIEWVNR